MRRPLYDFMDWEWFALLAVVYCLVCALVICLGKFLLP